MNADHDLRPLDEMLARGYATLREPVPGQREAILDGLARPQPTKLADRRPAVRRSLAWLAAAACLAILAVTLALLVPSPQRRVYGVEAVPARLAEVQTFRQQGHSIIYPRAGAHGEPVRVPIHDLVKRPNKFRQTWYGVSYPPDEQMIVKRGVRICNGRHEWGVSQDDKYCSTGPIGVLDAWIKTETQAQVFLTTLLGPPGVPYAKIGRESIGGRECDVYEASFDNPGHFQDKCVYKLWIDPETGYPVRSTQDELLPDGTTRRIQELEIAVNVPLDDKLFEFEPPEDFKTVMAEGPADPAALDDHYTSASFADGTLKQEKLEIWHAFRVTDSAALVVWRRSPPEVAHDGTSDWLSGVTFGVFGGHGKRRVEHDWVFQSRSPDVWNWSLVAVADGALPDRGGIRLQLEAPPLRATMELIPLRFPDRGLSRMVEAAARATLPDDAPNFKLEHLRTLAGQLQDRTRP